MTSEMQDVAYKCLCAKRSNLHFWQIFMVLASIRRPCTKTIAVVGLGLEYICWEERSTSAPVIAELMLSSVHQLGLLTIQHS
jgi:hypothetical protein